MKKIIASILLLITVIISACSPSGLRGTAKGVETGAHEANAEIADMVRDGNISTEEAARVTPIISEIETSAKQMQTRLDGYEQLTRADKRELVRGFIEDLERSTGRLEAAGVIKPRLEGYRRALRPSLRTLRVIEASIKS